MNATAVSPFLTPQVQQRPLKLLSPPPPPIMEKRLSSRSSTDELPLSLFFPTLVDLANDNREGENYITTSRPLKLKPRLSNCRDILLKRRTEYKEDKPRKLFCHEMQRRRRRYEDHYQGSQRQFILPGLLCDSHSLSAYEEGPEETV